MIREVIGFDLPEKYRLEDDDVEGYRALLAEHQEKFRKAAEKLGFLGHLERVYLKAENLDGSFPTHFLLEHLGLGNRSFLEEHRIDFPIQGPEELNAALISYKAYYNIMHFSRTVNPLGLERLLREFRNPADPALYLPKGVVIIE